MLCFGVAQWVWQSASYVAEDFPEGATNIPVKSGQLLSDIKAHGVVAALAHMDTYTLQYYPRGEAGGFSQRMDIWRNTGPLSIFRPDL